MKIADNNPLFLLLCPQIFKGMIIDITTEPFA
jgi:hypothetical protein